MLCCFALSLASALRSIFSAPCIPSGPAVLFDDFPATMTESDFSRPFIFGFGSSPSRCGQAAAYATPAQREISQVPTRSFPARCGLRPRRSDSVSHGDTAHIAFGAYGRLGLREFINFVAQ